MRISDWSDVCSSDLEDDLRQDEGHADECYQRLDHQHVAAHRDQHAAVHHRLRQALADEAAEVLDLGPDDGDRLAAALLAFVVGAPLEDAGEVRPVVADGAFAEPALVHVEGRSEAHTSELQSLMRISYA